MDQPTQIFDWRDLHGVIGCLARAPTSSVSFLIDGWKFRAIFSRHFLNWEFFKKKFAFQIEIGVPCPRPIEPWSVWRDALGCPLFDPVLRTQTFGSLPPLIDREACPPPKKRLKLKLNEKWISHRQTSCTTVWPTERPFRKRARTAKCPTASPPQRLWKSDSFTCRRRFPLEKSFLKGLRSPKSVSRCNF